MRALIIPNCEMIPHPSEIPLGSGIHGCCSPCAPVPLDGTILLRWILARSEFPEKEENSFIMEQELRWYQQLYRFHEGKGQCCQPRVDTFLLSPGMGCWDWTFPSSILEPGLALGDWQDSWDSASSSAKERNGNSVLGGMTQRLLQGGLYRAKIFLKLWENHPKTRTLKKVWTILDVVGP